MKTESKNIKKAVKKLMKQNKFSRAEFIIKQNIEVFLVEKGIF